MGLLTPVQRRGGLLGMLQNPADMAYASTPMMPNPQALMASIPQAAPQAAPQAGLLPPRERVSGWRLLDRVLGGETITGGLDAERVRLEQQAMRPTLLARQEELRKQAQAMGPAAAIAFATNPEKFGESLAEQYAPQVIGAGAVQSIAGTGARVGAPQRFEFGDTQQIFDPVTGQMSQLAERGPTIAEQTNKDKLAWDQQYGARQLDIQAMNADTTRAAAGTTLAPGQIRYGLDGAAVAENKNQTPGQEAAALARQQQADKVKAASDARVTANNNAINAVDTALGQVGFWTTGPLAGLSKVGGTPAADLASTIDTIEANLSFDKLAEMRANSPTGGALGGIAVRELELLGATVASLRQSQSQDQLRRNLNTIKTSLQRLNEAQRQAGTGSQLGGPSREALLAEARRRGLL